MCYIHFVSLSPIRTRHGYNVKNALFILRWKAACWLGMNCSRDFCVLIIRGKGKSEDVDLSSPVLSDVDVCLLAWRRWSWVFEILFCFIFRKEERKTTCFSRFHAKARVEKIKMCVVIFGDHCIYIYQQNWGGASLLALLTVACVGEGKSLPRNRYAFAEAGNSSSSTVVRLRSTEAELWPTNTTTQRRRDGCQLLLMSSSISACWPAVL